jgi:hypothetical protein
LFEEDENSSRHYFFPEWQIINLPKGLVYYSNRSLSTSKGKRHHHLVAFIPWLIFWVYDSYFLRLERLYRTHYAWLIKNRLQSDEFLLDVDRNEWKID